MSCPLLKQVEKFIVTGFSVRTKNDDEFNEHSAKLPTLWQQFYSSDLMSNSPIFGVYSDYESDSNGFYKVTAGGSHENREKNYSSVTVQTGNYLVFQKKGPMPFTVIETWKQVWSYFAKNEEFQRSFISDFELYKGADEVEIYIGIKG